MNIGILRGIKFLEPRVALIPTDVRELVNAGHNVFVENGAGILSNHEDHEYESAGAEVLPTSEKVFDIANLILKVQSPLSVEFELYAADQICISVLNLADNLDLLNALQKTNSTFIAAEMIGNETGEFPIFDAMNEIMGKIAITEAGKYLQQHLGGKGIMLSGTSVTSPARITILGSGTSAQAAAIQALLHQAQVTMIDENLDQLEKFQTKNPNSNLRTHEYSPVILRELLLETDVLISAKHQAGKKSPVWVSLADVKLLNPGSLVIDLAIDQGGCLETSRPTTAAKPVFIQDKILHFCVSSLSAVVPHTSSAVYSALLLPYVKMIADLGTREALAVNTDLRNGLNIYQGKLVNARLAENFHLQFYDILELFEMNI
jgi:alanine dehydrogenase